MVLALFQAATFIITKVFMALGAFLVSATLPWPFLAFLSPLLSEGKNKEEKKWTIYIPFVFVLRKAPVKQESRAGAGFLHAQARSTPRH